jgi:hypothetical protein
MSGSGAGPCPDVRRPALRPDPRHPSAHPSEKIQRNVLRAEAATVEGIADREQLAIGN